MPCIVGTLTRAASRRKGERLNILTFPTHERYETGLAMTGHNFYALRGPGIKDWNKQYAPVPPNYTLLDPTLDTRQIPVELDFDLVLSQNKAGQYPVAVQIARRLHLPLVCLEHTLPPKEWTPGQIARVMRMKGDINVFISEYSRAEWGWLENEARVVHHGIDTKVFKPTTPFKDRTPHALSVVNDWINRDWCCGYNLWKQAMDGLPVMVLGDTPGLSKAAKGVPELVAAYNNSQIFVNTSLISPIPTALLEAMACGCAVVTTGTCMIPNVVRHGINGLVADTPAKIRSCVERLLANPEEAEGMGRAARNWIENQFSMNTFIKNWNSVLYEAADLTYTGE